MGPVFLAFAAVMTFGDRGEVRPVSHATVIQHAKATSSMTFTFGSLPPANRYEDHWERGERMYEFLGLPHVGGRPDPRGPGCPF